MQIETLNGFVLIKKEQPKQSGLIIVGNADEHNQGTIAAIEDDNPIGLKVGDKVLFSQAKANAVKIDDVTYFISPASEIFGVVKDA